MSEQTPLVTVRSLVYNHEPYLRDCINGFLIQKTNFKFEVHLHDDASTDRSQAIIKEYAEKHPDIIKPFFEEENQYSKGMNALLNWGEVKTKYVALCEGDDYWTDPNKLQMQVDFLESHPEYSMCFHDVAIKAEEGREWYDVFGKLGQKLGLKIITDKYYPNAENVTLLTLGPSEFLNVIRNATVVCGQSFHLAAFSILFHKNYYCLDGKQDSRINNLLQKLQIDNRHIDKDSLNSVNIDTCTIDYSRADKFLELQRLHSANKLLEMIG